MECSCSPPIRRFDPTIWRLKSRHAGSSRCGSRNIPTYPPPGRRHGGGEKNAPPLPEHYWHTHNQFVALAYAASATTSLMLGTGITLVAQRDPIWTAKEVASLDHLSGGRLIFGVGYGWNVEEMAQHGVRYTQRRTVMREKIMFMKALWTEEEAHFEGENLPLEPSWAWPKPVQKPHPPIVMGAARGPKTLEQIVESAYEPQVGRQDRGRPPRCRSCHE